ncbi:NAD(P)H-nitrite reductase [Methylophaga lonarensis MPL]|uniref:NAD(P)H-nitrite reductase n=1 Tax=Methylophaga lonarensis MPL TaxID=1286106 RepID=M7NYN8_9GAMM|nr:(2Fe-2S)-binding protein [Methylophaga lonarensis]EMR12311.1 NAD(P)H-nitrite reductase [Methylophaga lonarensis MPL]
MVEFDDDPEEILCHCSGTTRGKIKSLVDKGADSIDKVGKATGASFGCGACDYDVEQYIAELTAQ